MREEGLIPLKKYDFAPSKPNLLFSMNAAPCIRYKKAKTHNSWRGDCRESSMRERRLLSVRE